MFIFAEKKLVKKPRYLVNNVKAMCITHMHTQKVKYKSWNKILHSVVLY